MEINTKVKKWIFYIIALAIGFFVLKYMIKLLLPFLIAFLIAFLLRKPVKIISERTGISKRPISFVFVFIVTFFLSFAVFLVCDRLINEIQRFANELSLNSDKYINSFFEMTEKLAEKLPFIEGIGANLTESVQNALSEIITDITTKIPSFVGKLMAMLPEILLFTVILIMSSYYFCADYEKITGNIAKLMPQKLKISINRMERRLKSTGISYLKACFVLMFITFGELLVGFSMLKIPYAFTLALITSFVDMMPILGVGTILIPWSIWAYLSGEKYLAFGLIIINLTVTVLRRFVEPRVIGQGIGLSPITTLASMYIGFKLYGFTGLFFAPLAAIIILQMLPYETAENLGFKGKTGINETSNRFKPKAVSKDS